MAWSSVFIISIAQGLFLVFVIARRSSGNLLASRLLLSLLGLMVFLNFVYLFIRTDLHRYLPQVYGTSVGILFLYGPLFYFYSRAIIDPSFQWKKKYWIHFSPYIIQFIINFNYFLLPTADWLWYDDNYLAGNIPIEIKEKVMIGLQSLHLSIYLLAIFYLVKSAKKTYRSERYIIPLSSRLRWLTALTWCFTILLIMITGLYIFVLVSGHYNPVTNYIITIVMGGIIYFIAYQLVFRSELVSPGFTEKYRSYISFKEDDANKYVHKLDALMKEQKIFIDPDLKLATLSKELSLPPHLLSKLINEKFGKTFSDYISEYRVKEFKERVNDPRYQVLTMYGIALDVGFNSKSSFNSVFKKITGQTPSEYKSSL